MKNQDIVSAVLSLGLLGAIGVLGYRNWDQIKGLFTGTKPGISQAPTVASLGLTATKIAGYAPTITMPTTGDIPYIQDYARFRPLN